MLVKALADVVIPQEYGLTDVDKLAIGQGICNPLLRKIRADLQRNIEEDVPMSDESVNRLDPRYSWFSRHQTIWFWTCWLLHWAIQRYSHGVSSPGRHVRTRLYFTSESHLHSLLTVLRFGGLVEVISIHPSQLFVGDIIFFNQRVKKEQMSSGDVPWITSVKYQSSITCHK